MLLVPNDGGVARGGAEARGDAAHVPRVQGGAAHHRRRVHGDGEHARAAARQERLAREPPGLQPAPVAALARRPAPRRAPPARYYLLVPTACRAKPKYMLLFYFGTLVKSCQAYGCVFDFHSEWNMELFNLTR